MLLVFRSAASYGAGGKQDFTQLFKQLDRDGSQGLDEEEFRRAMRKQGKLTLARGWSDAKLRRVFRQVDTDGSGLITVDEFNAWMGPPPSTVSYSLVLYLEFCMGAILLTAPYVCRRIATTWSAHALAERCRRFAHAPAASLIRRSSRCGRNSELQLS
jgi:hypothetical protein